MGKSQPRTEPRMSKGTYKSAPMVALYWLLNRLFTYWFMSDVLPTLHKREQNDKFQFHGSRLNTSQHVPTVA